MYWCKECGSETKKWYGRCLTCKEYNTLVEFKEKSVSNSKKTNQDLNKFDQNISLEKLSEVKIKSDKRQSTNIPELDLVLGGGFVEGSLILLGGNPGIGKSTLILQMAAEVTKSKKLLYISGEESTTQIKLRANRLNLEPENNFLIGNFKELEEIFKIATKNEIKYLIIDSIQTIFTSSNTSSSGSVSQVKECTLQLMYFAKQQNITIIIIGHVTKDGEIAGPKLLEHMVDTVLYLEGEKNTGYKVLRSIKNRYGKAGEIGLFEMTSVGLLSVKSIESFFLEEDIDASGTVIGVLEEGERNMFVEIQSLLIPTDFGYPKRTTQGYDLQRLNLLLGVIQKRLDLNFTNYDCYLNIANGFKSKQISLDLAVVASLISARNDIEIPRDELFIGEVSLSGTIKRVYNQEEKVEQALKLGFNKIYCNNNKSIKFKNENKIIDCRNIKSLGLHKK